MSIIIFKPKSQVIPKDMLSRCHTDNPDGIGFSYNKNDKIITEKVFKNFDSFYDKFEKIQNESSVLIHFAEKDFPISTKKFCGPFKLDENHVLVHTGDVFSTEELKNEDISQSYNLLLKLRSIWQPGFFNKTYFRWLLEEYFPDTKNKMVIMNNQGSSHIFNSNKFGGTFINGSWFSDTPIYKYTPTVSNSKSNVTRTVYKNNGASYIPVNDFLKKDHKACFKCKLQTIVSIASQINGDQYCFSCHTQVVNILAKKNIENKSFPYEEDLEYLKENLFLKEEANLDPKMVDIFSFF